MERKSRDRGKPAPYGGACVNCARAKRRCILRTGGGGCERCIRLKEECNPSPTIRKKRSKPTRSRAACLEQKIDGLVSLLESHQDAIGPGSSQTSGSYPYKLPEGAEVPPDEAEKCFQRFYNEYLQFLPLVHIEKGMASRKLRQQYPFLWTCIIAVTSTNIAQQDSLGRAVREIAAREVVVEGKRTVDLLLGLLCFIAWGYFRFSMSPVLTVFSHLCTALTLELELQSRRPVDLTSNRVPLPSIGSQIQGTSRDQQPMGTEQRRTALACYLITSCVATFQSRNESLAWSPYLEESLNMIHNASDSPGDSLLVHIVKLQRILNKATAIKNQLRDTDSEQSTRLIPPYIFSLNAQLAEARRSTPSNLATNTTLQAMDLYTEICINEIILTRLRHMSLLSDPDTSSMEALTTCLNASKACVDIMSMFQPAEYASFPFFLWKQFRHAILTLIRLASLEDPGWDVNLVRRTVDISSLLDQAAENLRILEGATGFNAGGQGNVFTKSLAWVDAMKSWLVSVYDPSPGGEDTPRQSGLSVSPAGDALLPEQGTRDATEQPISGIDMFTILDEDLFGEGSLGWWPQGLSDSIGTYAD